MTLLLSSKQLDNPTQRLIWDPVTGDSELRLVDPLGQSEGLLRFTTIKPSGLSYCEERFQLQEPLLIDQDNCDPHFMMEMSFTLLGYNHTEDISQGENFFFLGWREVGFKDSYKWDPQNDIDKFDLYLEDGILSEWLLTAIDDLPKPLQKIAAGSEHFTPHDQFWQKRGSTPLMRQIIQQILNCPYQGLTQRMYREGKALELLSLRLEQLVENKIRRTLGKLDVDRIWAAQQILLNCLQDPPTILELAQQVELNDFKLKQGFRQVFDTTVFGYLQQQRMEQARLALLDPDASVETVAQAIGYNNRSSFARAFYKQFGIYPKAFQISQRSRGIR